MAIHALVKGISLALALTTATVHAIYPGSLHHVPRIHTLREAALVQQTLDKTQRQSYNFSVPVDHFHNETKYEPHSDDFYDLRYWIDDTYYKPGGPVILIASGEITSVLRLGYMEQGIGKILSEATGGLTVVLEHRYYGTSYPVPDLSTKNMRFLDTEQALADYSYFARHIQYPGLEKYNLTSHTTPYITYGGSYAGTFVALLRKLYPDDFWGSISGSGVPELFFEFWQYLEAIRIFGDEECVDMAAKLVRIVDNVLTNTDRTAAKKLKGFFGFEDLADDDFAYYINQGPMSLQGSVWDPDFDSSYLAEYCAAITTGRALYASTQSIHADANDILVAAGYYDETHDLLPRLLNWIGHGRTIKKKDLETCEKEGGTSDFFANNCFTKRGALDDVSIPQGMIRPWTYQTCTQWGFFVTGSGVPEGKLPLMSRLVDVDYASLWCPEAFGIPADPDLHSINKYGGFNFSHSRLAFVDGSHDPWRQAGVHALGINKDRQSTDSEPFILIDGGVHHWEQYGPKPNATGSWLPPPDVKRAQDEEVRFVKVWLEEFAQERGTVAQGDGEWDLEL